MKGDTWYKTDPNGNVLGHWMWDGSAWQPRTLDNAVIANLDAAKIITGFLDAARIRAKSISTSKLLVVSDTNLIEDFYHNSPRDAGWTPTTRLVHVPEGGRSINTDALKIVGNAANQTYTVQSSAPIKDANNNIIGITPGREIPVTGGASYRAQCWIKPAADIDIGAARMVIVEKDGSSQTIKTTYFDATADVEAGTNKIYADRWALAIGTFEADQSTTKVLYGYRVTSAVTATNSVLFTEPMLIRMADAELIVDGTITGRHIAAESIGTDQLEAKSIKAEKIDAGAIELYHLSSAVGQSLDITSNESVNIIISQLNKVAGDLDDTSTQLNNLAMYYSFTSQGAIIGKEDSSVQLRIQNDRIEIVDSGTVISYWDSGRMVVPSFVGIEVELGNHKLEKFGTGTVVRLI